MAKRYLEMENFVCGIRNITIPKELPASPNGYLADCRSKNLIDNKVHYLQKKVSLQGHPALLLPQGAESQNIIMTVDNSC